MPRFDALFAELDVASGPDDVCIVANSDILFDGSTAKALDMAADEFWCLSRHEWCLPDDWSLLDAEYSQDTWIWRGRSRLSHITFPLGRCACDNVLAYRAAVAGYRVGNPARDVVTRHVHQDVLPGHGAQRDDQRPWLPGPYVYVKPHQLAEPPHTQLICRAPSGLLPFPTDRRPRPEFVIIASRPRAGTYRLWSLLTSMPGVAILEEPFHRRGRSPDAWDATVDPCLWLRTRRLAGDSDSGFLSSSPGAHWLFGAIVQPDQVHPDRPESAAIVAALHRVATHVVILSREDSLAQLASLKIAEATDDWRSAPEDAPRSERVTITQEELDHFREEMAASVAQDRIRWAGLAQLEVTYEQLRDDYDATLKRLGDFLGLDMRYARAGTVKRDRRPIDQAVTTPDRVTVTVDGAVLHVPARCAEDCRKMAEPILRADEYELLPIRRAGHQVRTVLDVGGNCGAFGVAVRRLWPEARIIAWEPHPDLAECYRLNVPGAEVHEAAAWSSAGPVTLRVHETYPGGDCVAGAWKRPDEITGECVVPAETVSTNIPADWPEIDVLKLDCEGAESAVLADLAGAGQLARVRWIRGEWHGAENVDRCQRILAGTHVSNFAPGDTVGFFIAHRGQPAPQQSCCGG
jgi:FkbM family methyltransferase